EISPSRGTGSSASARTSVTRIGPTPPSRRVLKSKSEGPHWLPVGQSPSVRQADPVGTQAARAIPPSIGQSAGLRQGPPARSPSEHFRQEVALHVPPPGPHS